MNNRSLSREDIPVDPESMLRFATILSIDLAAARCVAVIGDASGEDFIKTPPIRWIAPRAGKTRIWSPPSIGEQVMVISPSAELENAVVVMGIVSDSFPPAGNSEVDMIDFEDGSRIIYDAQAKHLTIDLTEGAKAMINAPEGVTINGDVTITGDVNVDGEISSTGDQIADGISQIGHVHGNVQAGSSDTGRPK